MIARVACLGLVAVVGVGLTGCGVSPEGTRKMWRSVQSSLGKASGSSASQALSFSIGFEVDCARDGSAEFEAKLDTDDSFRDAFSAVFGYQITYDGCQPDENVLDGELTYAAELKTSTTDDSGLFGLRYIYQGTISSKGETNGTCEIDVVGHLDASAERAPGEEFKSDVSMEYEGTICGQDAHEVLEARADLDSDA